MSYKIYCPECGRILGDTTHAIDGLRLNCRGCKKTVDIKLVVATNDNLLTNIYKEKTNAD